MFGNAQMKTFEEAFAKKPAKKADASKPKVPEKPKLLDSSREQNVGIVLKFLKMSLDELNDSLVEMV